MVAVAVGLATGPCGVPKSWGCGVPTSTGTAPDLGSVALIIKIYSSHIPPHLFQPFLDILFPSPDLTPIAPPYSTCQRRFTLLLHLVLPPESPGRGATVHLDGAPTRRPPPLFCASLPCSAATRSSSREPVTFVPHLVPPLHCPRPAPRSLSSPGVLPYKSTFLLLTASVARTSAPPLSASTGGPVSCRSKSVCAVFFCPPSLVHPPLPPCVLRRRLVSSGV